MTTVNILSMSPLLLLASTIVVLMLTIAFYRHHALIAGMTITGLFLSGSAIALVWPASPAEISKLLIIDHLGLLYAGLLLSATVGVTLISYSYLKEQIYQAEEYYLLLLLALFGALVIVYSNHFAAFFLGLEILSISLYGLVGYLRGREHNIEAAIKYLVLAAASAGFLMFGVALIYANQGTMAFDQLKAPLIANLSLHSILLLTGIGMLFVGIGFKLAVVPFHMWTPDVYQGAPAPVSAFIATVSKGAIFVFFLRLIQGFQIENDISFRMVLIIIAVLSMLVGNLLALLQKNVKRILAYSSIAHIGYLLIALIASSTLAIAAATFYLVAYFVTILGAFGVVSMLSDTKKDAENLEDYHGLFWYRPWIALVMTLALLSLIGMPLTAGFVGKFYLLSAGIGASLWVLVIALVISSAIGLYYYLRVIVAMFSPLDSKLVTSNTALSSSLSAGLALGMLVLLLIWLGLYPTPLINLIQSAISMLS